MGDENKQLNTLLVIAGLWAASVIGLLFTLESISHDKNYGKVQGKVIGDYYTVLKKGNLTEGVLIDYTYTVNGVDYTAKHLTKDDPNTAQTVLVYYNPRDPQESYLEPTDHSLLTFCTTALGILSLVLGYSIYKYYNPYGWGIDIS